MRVLRIELRHSPTLIVLPLLVFLAGTFTERGLLKGVYLGSNITTSLLASVQLLGPICAGLAAWAATRETRRGVSYLRRLAVQSGATLVAIETLALALPVVLALVLVATFVTTRAAIAGMYGRVSVLGVLAGLLGILVHVSLGYAAGRVWPRAAVAPVITLASYLFVVWNLDQAGRPFYLLAPVTVENATAFYTWWPNLFLWQNLWLLGVAILPLSLLAWVSSQTRLPVVASVLAVAAAGLGGWHLWSYGGLFFDVRHGANVRLSCSNSDGLQICTHPAFASGTGELARAFRPVLTRLADTPAATAHLEQARRGPNTGRGSDVFHIDDLSPGFAAQAVAEFVGDQIDINACAKPARSDASSLTRLVADWIITGNPSSSSYREAWPVAAKALGRLTSIQQQQRWLGDHFQQFRTCRLDDRAFTP
jgi:hypothetical protein